MKKHNQQGFAHHLMIIGIAVLVVAAVGFAGFKVYQNRQVDAKAYSWTNIMPGATYVRVYACKTDLGNDWRLRAYAKNTWTGGGETPSWAVSNQDMTRLLGGNVSNGTQTNVHYTNINKAKLKSITATVGGSNKGGGGDMYLMSRIANCY